MSREAVVATKIAVRYGDQLSLSPVSFSLAEGKLYFLIGPNGSGKSTLISSILGLTEHTGQAKVLGRPAKEVYHQLGYVPQRFSFDRSIPLTIRELLTLSLDFCGCQKKAAEEHLKDALDLVDLTSLIDRPLAELSGGQLQRVLLARALVHHPKVLFLDEPEAGIDRQAEHSLYPLLKKLVNDGLTVLIASHEIDAARRWADQVILLNGKLVDIGDPVTLLTKPKLKDLFSS